jgi:hypothetical protein
LYSDRESSLLAFKPSIPKACPIWRGAGYIVASPSPGFLICDRVWEVGGRVAITHLLRIYEAL